MYEMSKFNEMVQEDNLTDEQKELALKYYQIGADANRGVLTLDINTLEELVRNYIKYTDNDDHNIQKLRDLVSKIENSPGEVEDMIQDKFNNGDIEYNEYSNFYDDVMIETICDIEDEMSVQFLNSIGIEIDSLYL